MSPGAISWETAGDINEMTLQEWVLEKAWLQRHKILIVLLVTKY